MSLYCHIRLPLADLERLAARFPSHVIIGGADPAELDTYVNIAPEVASLEFASIVDTLRSGDATGLWLESMKYLRDPRTNPHDYAAGAYKHSPLGRILHSAMTDSEWSGSVAVFDGCIDSVIRGSRVSCWTILSSAACLPWDCMGDPLLIWR